MNKLSNLFIKTSLVYLAISTVLGVLITIGPGYSFMHSHFALIGWVSFFIFGAAYKIIPHYSGKYSERLGLIQFWLFQYLCSYITYERVSVKKILSNRFQ